MEVTFLSLALLTNEYKLIIFVMTSRIITKAFLRLKLMSPLMCCHGDIMTILSQKPPRRRSRLIPRVLCTSHPVWLRRRIHSRQTVNPDECRDYSALFGLFRDISGYPTPCLLNHLYAALGTVCWIYYRPHYMKDVKTMYSGRHKAISTQYT